MYEGREKTERSSEDGELGGESACYAHLLDDKGHLVSDAGWHRVQSTDHHADEDVSSRSSHSDD